MPNTSRGYTYPDSTGHDRLWEHYEELATDINDDVDATFKKPLVRLVQKATQNLLDGAAGNSSITFAAGSEEIDTHGFHDTVTNNSRITPNVAGYYRLRGYVYMASGTYSQLVVGILKNGATIHYDVERPDPASAAVGAKVEVEASANGSGDYFQFNAQQHSGGTKATNVTAGFESTFTCEWIRPL
jgi:hypothetical protein